MFDFIIDAVVFLGFLHFKRGEQEGEATFAVEIEELLGFSDDAQIAVKHEHGGAGICLHAVFEIEHHFIKYHLSFIIFKDGEALVDGFLIEGGEGIKIALQYRRVDSA